jgi:UDP-N-acetylmuramoyl-L-alanyl-D-glutamate--2,6-diaminopimelate ligase
VNAILEEAGYKTAIASTLRIKIGDESKRNLYKMTMPGRFFTQKFIRHAVDEQCDYVIVEITSEGAKQFRHKFLELDALIVTNVSPEHIESHGSYEKYLAAKLKIAEALEKSNKKDKVIIVNSDDKESGKFLAVKIPRKETYSLNDAQPFELTERGSRITFEWKRIKLNLPGEFNVYNTLAAAVFARSQKIDTVVIKKALEKFSGVRGRMEEVKEWPEIAGQTGKQNFTVIVDYAHTKDSLEKAYGAYPNKKKICILGSTGGGRDKWKRKEMGAVADTNCEHIILTNEDPYDEDPEKIVRDVSEGIKNTEYEIIMDRREAITAALRAATSGDIVFITGKGTDPYIMEAHGKKTPWDDATVAREELQKLLKNKQ